MANASVAMDVMSSKMDNNGRAAPRIPAFNGDNVNERQISSAGPRRGRRNSNDSLAPLGTSKRRSSSMDRQPQERDIGPYDYLSPADDYSPYDQDYIEGGHQSPGDDDFDDDDK